MKKIVLVALTRFRFMNPLVSHLAEENLTTQMIMMKQEGDIGIMAKLKKYLNTIILFYREIHLIGKF